MVGFVVGRKGSIVIGFVGFGAAEPKCYLLFRSFSPKQEKPSKTPGSSMDPFNCPYGNCSTRTFVAIVPPMFSKMGSRSLPAPVYAAFPSKLMSSGK